MLCENETKDNTTNKSELDMGSANERTRSRPNKANPAHKL